MLKEHFKARRAHWQVGAVYTEVSAHFLAWKCCAGTTVRCRGTNVVILGVEPLNRRVSKWCIIFRFTQGLTGTTCLCRCTTGYEKVKRSSVCAQTIAELGHVSERHQEICWRSNCVTRVRVESLVHERSTRIFFTASIITALLTGLGWDKCPMHHYTSKRRHWSLSLCIERFKFTRQINQYHIHTYIMKRFHI